MIKFGTDGWRAVIADTFTFENVRLVSQAVAEVLLSEHTGDAPPQAVIGYDTRFLSDRFATETARVFAANGITSWLTRTDAPTPAISYNVKAKGANLGVVITASHNPPRYNGFKLKSRHGGSAPAKECHAVEARLAELQAKQIQPAKMDYEQAVQSGLIQRFDPSWAYYEHLSTLIDLDKISEGELRIVADSMWGAGRGAFTSILSRTRSRVTEIRGQLNPGFGGIHPEPIERHLTELAAAIQREHAQIGLATDGDADRIGAMDANGTFVDPHQIMALALRHLVEVKGLRGEVVKTVSTTLMIDAIAAKHGLKVHETPVGFNHIGDLMTQNDVLIGGEESGGISIKGHIPEGDGILMGLLLLEVLAHAGTPLHEVIQEMQTQFGPAVYERIDARLSVQRPKNEMVQVILDHAPSAIAGETIQRVDTLDGIKFYLNDGSWLLIRPSGTEPVLRIYAEGHSREAVKAMLQVGQQMGDLIKETSPIHS